MHTPPEKSAAAPSHLDPKDLAHFLILHGHWAQGTKPQRIPSRFCCLHMERIDSNEMGPLFKELQKLLPSLTADTFSRGPIRDSMLYADPEDLRRVRGLARKQSTPSR